VSALPDVSVDRRSTAKLEKVDGDLKVEGNARILPQPAGW